MQIPSEVVPKVKRGGTITDNGVFRGKWGSGKSAREVVVEHPEYQGRFPAVSKVLDEVNLEGSTIVSINPELLAKLAEAIVAGPDDHCNPPHVTLVIPKNGLGPIGVTALNGFGVIMPCEKETDNKEIGTFKSLVEEYKASL